MPKESQKKKNAKREYGRMCRVIDAEFSKLPTYNIGFSFNDEHLPKTVEEAWDKFLTWALYVDEFLLKKGLPKLRYVAVLEEAPDGVKRFHFHGMMFLPIPYNEEGMKWIYGFQDEVKQIKKEYYKDNIARYIIKEWNNHDRKDPTCFRTNVFSHFKPQEMRAKLRGFTSENWEDLSLDEPFHSDEDMHLKYFGIIFQDMAKFCEDNDLAEFTPEEFMTWFDTGEKDSSSEDTKNSPETPV